MGLTFGDDQNLDSDSRFCYRFFTIVRLGKNRGLFHFAEIFSPPSALQLSEKSHCINKIIQKHQTLLKGESFIFFSFQRFQVGDNQAYRKTKYLFIIICKRTAIK